jgi:hypothetical protein
MLSTRIICDEFARLVHEIEQERVNDGKNPKFDTYQDAMIYVYETIEDMKSVLKSNASEFESRGMRLAARLAAVCLKLMCERCDVQTFQEMARANGLVFDHAEFAQEEAVEELEIDTECFQLPPLGGFTDEERAKLKAERDERIKQAKEAVENDLESTLHKQLNRWQRAKWIGARLDAESEQQGSSNLTCNVTLAESCPIRQSSEPTPSTAAKSVSADEIAQSDERKRKIREKTEAKLQRAYKKREKELQRAKLISAPAQNNYSEQPVTSKVTNALASVVANDNTAPAETKPMPVPETKSQSNQEQEKTA